MTGTKEFWKWANEESRQNLKEAAEQFIKDCERWWTIQRLLKEKGAIKFDPPVEVRWE